MSWLNEGRSSSRHVFNRFYNQACLRAVAPKHEHSFVGLAHLSTLTWLTCVEGLPAKWVSPVLSQKRGKGGGGAPNERKAETLVSHDPPNPLGARSAVWWTIFLSSSWAQTIASQAKMASCEE